MHHTLAMVRGYRRASGRVRFHQYTRTALYFFWVAEAGAVAVWMLAAPPESPVWARSLIALLGATHVWLNVWLTRDGLACYLHGAPRPVRVLVAGWLVTLVATAVTLALVGTGRAAEEAAIVITWFPVFFVGPAVLVLPILRGAALAAVPTTGAVVGLLVMDLPPGGSLGLAITSVATGAFLGATFRSSAWTLRVVDELDAARATQARLAVAEERLRFGRDMHDVLGRNLAVIALKSELAVQLAQRGSPAAVDQMTEVQRIARQSQQEMRAVLRGYRDADLHAELAGARGVLEAAGICCTVSADAAGEVPAGQRIPLGWAVREAATNVLRHSEATRCDLRVDRDATGAVVLTVENDGVPDDTDDPRRGPGAAGGGTAGRVSAGHVSAVAGPAGDGTAERVAGWDVVAEGMPGGGTDEDEGSGGEGGPDGDGSRPDGGEPARPSGSGRGADGPDGEPGDPAARRPGTGLTGLRERLAAVGGTLATGTGDGPGTFVLTARIPPDAAAEPPTAADPAVPGLATPGTGGRGRIGGQRRAGRSRWSVLPGRSGGRAATGKPAGSALRNGTGDRAASAAADDVSARDDVSAGDDVSAREGVAAREGLGERGAVGEGGGTGGIDGNGGADDAAAR